MMCGDGRAVRMLLQEAGGQAPAAPRQLPHGRRTMTGPDPKAPVGPAGLQHPRFARAYARAIDGMNRRGGTEHRRDLLGSLQGRVIEIGAGDGSAFALYPATVTEVLAVEPDDYLRALATGRAVSAPVPVIVVAGPRRLSLLPMKALTR